MIKHTMLNKHNESGIILVTVVIVTLVMMILVVGIISTTVSQSLSSQHQIERLKAEQFAKGAMWYNYMGLITGGPPAAPPPAILDGTQYNAAVATGAVNPDGTTTYNITVNYNIP